MRSLFKRLLLGALTVILTAAAHAAESTTQLMPPKSGTIKVAFVLSEGATVIDFAGPWDVFESVMLDGKGTMEDLMPFELYTVGPSKSPVHSSGTLHGHHGLTITPEYDFADAPMPDIVVVPAQAGSPSLNGWLLKAHAQHKLIMSVCTGAFQLAKTGLLDGKKATTHHTAYANFSSRYPNIQLVQSVRYVRSDPIVFTAGGETSGIDLALHIVEGYYGAKVAQKTADEMEYQGTGWKTNQGLSYSQ